MSAIDPEIMETAHIPVLRDEVIAALVPQGADVARVIDGTLGAGGHTLALLEQGVDTVLGMDVDPDALAIARSRLVQFDDRVRIMHRSYVHMIETAHEVGWEQVDGILLDFGVSSMQLDNAERGFAFMQDGPLDMRFDPTSSLPSAADLVNHWDADALAAIFFKYGEEKFSRRIAQMIVDKRPFQTTGELAEAIKGAVPAFSRRGKKGGSSIHPATRVFQALRIAVNDELRAVETVLPVAITLLRPGGRLAVISFHSLEDRIVKQTFKDTSTEIVSPPGMVLEEKAAVVKLITRKPLTADDEEIAQNPRSRSAKLRVVEKL